MHLVYGMQSDSLDERPGKEVRQSSLPAGTGDVLGAGDEEDGDVVAAAVRVGGVDEGLAGGLRGCRRCGSAGEDAGDVGVGEFAGEAVGGEQVRGRRAGRCGRRCRARRSGCEPMARVMMLRMGERLAWSAADEAGADLLLDQGVVLGEEFEERRGGRR